MKVLTCVSTGQSISLDERIASSGEGEVWRTNQNGYVAKIYHSPAPERIEKLKVMVAYPPKDPNSHQNHISFAWPKSLLKDRCGDCVGFLMPAITGSVDLLYVYNPVLRQRTLPGFNWHYLHATALNTVSIIQAIHAEGYVLGDIKPQNLLVNNRALVSVIDTDSFQVRHPGNGKVHRCLVGSEGFTPVELLDKDLSTIDQTEVHDRFRLAVIIHLLLFGDQPFKGQWIGDGDSLEPTELLRRGFWPYAPNSLIQPGALTIPLEIVHPKIQHCFLRCFNDGHTTPYLRPTTDEWAKALKMAIADLTACSHIKNHYYSKTYGKCYWCERTNNLGVDIFPDVARTRAQSPATIPPPQPKVFAADDVTELLNQKGQEITVEGKVVSTAEHAMQNKFILNFDAPSAAASGFGAFRIVITSPSIQSLAEFLGVKIKRLKDLIGKNIRIKGNIEVHKAKKYFYPQFVLEDPKMKLLKKSSKVNNFPNQSNNVLSQKPKVAKASKKSYRRTKPVKAVNFTSVKPEQRAKNYYSYYQQGLSRARVGDNLGAIDAYNRALVLNPNNALVYRSRGNAYARLNKSQRAIEDYNQALYLAPNDDLAYYNRGIIREKLGDRRGAFDDFQKSARLGNQLARQKL